MGGDTSGDCRACGGRPPTRRSKFHMGRCRAAHRDALPSPATAPRVAWVTTWNIRCGIASYAKNLAKGVPAGALQVFASRAEDLLEPDELFVQRCWSQGWEDDLEGLHVAIRRSGATKAVIQFNFGFFEIIWFQNPAGVI